MQEPVRPTNSAAGGVGFKIESAFALASDGLPASAFSAVYGDRASAIATAIEGVEDPKEKEVRVIDVATGLVVWRSTEEAFE